MLAAMEANLRFHFFPLPYFHVDGVVGLLHFLQIGGLPLCSETKQKVAQINAVELLHLNSCRTVGTKNRLLYVGLCEERGCA